MKSSSKTINPPAVRERPILFSSPMVRAILDGRKTVTRRIVKLHAPYIVMGEKDDGTSWPWFENPEDGETGFLPCPFGVPGDRLWVKERWRKTTDRMGYGCVEYAAGGSREILCDESGEGDAVGIGKRTSAARNTGPKWKSPIFMPRWASRLTLEVVSVRVDRLKEITPDEVAKEGISGKGEEIRRASGDCLASALCYLEDFKTLWESLNGAGSWAANPWIWRIEFRRLP